MASKSKIEWCDATWNVTAGCTKCATGCLSCWGERWAQRLAAMAERDFQRGLRYGRKFSYQKVVRYRDGKPTAEWNGNVFCDEKALGDPLHWRKPRRVFVNSMSDLFHPQVPESFIRACFVTMGRARQHTYQVLTKRGERMAQIFDGWMRDGLTLREGYTLRRDEMCAPLPNVWLGVSASTQADYDEQVKHLRKCPAALHFVSLEPLLEGLILKLKSLKPTRGYEFSDVARARIHWVIVGGESGPKARPCEVKWIRSIRRQCADADVPCFVKQLGANLRGYNYHCWRCGHGDWGAIDHVPGRHPGVWNCNVCGADSSRCRHPKGGDPDEWPEDLRVQEMPSSKAR